MESAGGGKDRLGRAQSGRQGSECGRCEDGAWGHGGKILEDGIQSDFATNSAAGGAEHVAGQAGEVDRRGRGEEGVDDVAGVCALLFAAENNVQNIISLANDSLREKKAGGQFAIMARRAHDYRHAPISYANFQRFFNGDWIGFRNPDSRRAPAVHRHGGGGGIHRIAVASRGTRIMPR